MAGLILGLSGADRASATPETPGDSAPIIRVEHPPEPAEITAMKARVGQVSRAIAEVKKKRGYAWSSAKLALSAEQQRLWGIVRARRLHCNPLREIQRLESDVARFAQGENPMMRPGLHRQAYLSALDHRVHSYALYVPQSISTGGRLPLIVMLHGMQSNPMRAIGRLFDLPSEQLADPLITCDRPTLPPQQALVVAPDGCGDALFRGMGAADVSTVVRRVMQMYRVDPQRITITGLSMGGTGAVEIALTNPHLYAGVLALCGYYDRRMDSAIRNQALLPWESQLVAAYSPVDWSINGRGIPLVLLHGQHDGPQRAKRLHERYQQLGYQVDLQFYPVGHNVWTPGYLSGRAFSILGRFRKQLTPKTVVFSTGYPRVQRGYWLSIERFGDHSLWARVWAEVQDRTHLQLRTTNVSELQVTLPSAHLAHKREVQLKINQSDLTIPPAQSKGARRVTLIHDGATWRLRTEADLKARAGWKKPRLSGPIADIYYEPIVVVYGTNGGKNKRLWEVAKRLSRYSSRVNIEYPLIADKRFTPRMAQRSAVILVGNEQTNTVLARLGSKLPIRVKHEEVVVGSQHFFGEDVGATFIYPNPEAPKKYLRVVGITGDASIQIFEKLPTYLPDYMVFDQQMAARRNMRVVGADRRYLAAGYFTEQWQLLRPKEPVAQP